MRTFLEFNKLRYLLVGITLLVTAMPLVLTLCGLTFGDVDGDTASSHFAGWTAGNAFYRLDIFVLGVVAFTTVMAGAYARVSSSRFVTLFATALALAGLAEAVQIVPLVWRGAPVDFHTSAVWAASLSRVAGTLLLILGLAVIRADRRGRTRRDQLVILGVGILVLAGLWWSMLHWVAPADLTLRQVNLAGLVADGILAGLLLLETRRQRLRMLGLGVLGSLIPLAAGQLWLAFGVTSVHDGGFHIAAVLKWFAWLLAPGGLIVDYLNVYYSRGLVREKRFLRAVIDAIPHFVFARDSEGRFTLVNRSVAEFYGHQVKDIEGRHVSFVHADPDQCRIWLDEDRRTLESGEESIMPETETSGARGHKIWVTAIKKPLPTLRGEKPQLLGVSIDVTEQKRTKMALAERLKMERAAAGIQEAFVHATPDGFAQTMSTVLLYLGNFTGASRCFLYRLEPGGPGARLDYSWRRSHHGPSGELPAVLPPDQLEWIRDWFGASMPVSVADMSELPARARPFVEAWGHRGDNAFLAVPIMNQGVLFGILGVDARGRHQWRQEETNLLRMVADLFITVWTKQEMERSLVSAMQEAQESNRTKSEFLANMSHEIRTPMNCVIGLTDLLTDMDPTPGQRQYLEMIRQSGNMLLDLINDVLDLSKIEAGRLELEAVETDLRALVEEVVGMTSFNAQARGLELVCRCAPGAPDQVVVDPARLRQVLTNLLNNASKFTLEGHIYLNVEPVGRRPDGRLDVRFQVTDTGIGIDQEKLDAIFDKFTQADTSTTRRFGGTGLGLSISQNLVQLMGGRISAESTPGKGSSFSFVLPVEVVAGAESHRSVPRHEHVLVVAGHPLSGEVLAEAARQLGFECSVAEDPDQARERAADLATDADCPLTAVLIDDRFDGEASQPLRDQLRASPDFAAHRLQVLLMSSLVNLQRENEIRDRGYSGALAKPMRPQQLADLLTCRRGAFVSCDCSTPAPSADAAGAPLAARRILLAEDNPFNQKVAVGMLKMLGCTVEVANNGQEALDLLKAGDFDLVFMDCQMPVMDGYEATQKIRRLPAPLSAVPVVAMTANALSGDRQACFDAGMDDFLSKPINKARLSAMLQKWERTTVS